MDTILYGYYIIWILYYMDTIFYGYYVIYGYYTQTVSVMGVGGAHYQTMSTTTTPDTKSMSIYLRLGHYRKRSLISSSIQQARFRFNCDTFDTYRFSMIFDIVLKRRMRRMSVNS